MTSAGDVDRRFRRFRVQEVATMTVVYALFYVCRLAFSATKKSMIEQGAYTAKEIGYVGSAMLIAYAIGKCVNGQPNSRRGTFVVGGHSIDFFKILGRVTTASPDGRRFGDELSKNISPAPGADKEGATALVDSIAGIDFAQLPGDTAFDIMLHPSTAAGEKGLDLMQALVSVYFDNGGRAVHFNVVAPETLREAQRSPEKYSNLQIRVCGWNVFWNSLSKAEQDAYIVRAESILK